VQALAATGQVVDDDDEDDGTLMLPVWAVDAAEGAPSWALSRNAAALSNIAILPLVGYGRDIRDLKNVQAVIFVKDYSVYRSKKFKVSHFRKRVGKSNIVVTIVYIYIYVPK